MRLGVDVGGTFTDAVLVAEDGATYTAKVPTTAGDQAVGVLAAVEEVLARAGSGPQDVRRFAHGMTVATNALLEGKTARTALIATDGFTDVIELGRQARPHLYRLCDATPEPLVTAELRYGAPERCGPDGPLVALDVERAQEVVDEVARAQPQAVAVALLHSYAHPEHERLLDGLLKERLPATHVSVSSELVGTFREYERTATTALDAALSPLVGSYLRKLAEEASRRRMIEPEIMQSSGGLASVERAASHAALTVLSGPAGGAGGALRLAELAGVEDVLCCDMGGTSCDVCLITGGQVAETAQRTIAGRPVALPALDIHTVGAGGGSIAWRDGGGALRVGPQSAGAEPGPACYGRGGRQATVTDANLLLGRLPEEEPLAGGLRLDRDAAERAVRRLADELGLTTEECAAGIVRVAEAEMGRALRVMSVERGVDARELTLMAFGGAGPLHACALAEGLGITRVLCPRTSGVLCALGLAAAAPRRDVSRTVMLRGEAFSRDALASIRDDLLARARSAHLAQQQLLAQGRALAQEQPLAQEQAQAQERPLAQVRPLAQEQALAQGQPSTQGQPSAQTRLASAQTALARAGERERMVYELRYRGQSHELPVELDSTEPQDICEAFAQAHEQRYGYRDEHSEVELVTVRASVWEAAPELDLASESPQRAPSPDSTPDHTRIEGPAVWPLPEATLYVAPGWTAQEDVWGTVRLERTRRA